MSFFALPSHLGAKADPDLVRSDEQHLLAIESALHGARTGLEQRLAEARQSPGGTGTQALERDEEVHRLAARLRTVNRYGVDLCLGRIVPADGSPAVYVGRLGLAAPSGERLLVDWRSPAAAPFFAATHADPQGLMSRRRFRWHVGQVVDFWDEVFSPDGLESTAALDDQSAFIASLGADRSERMRDVLGTIQADQDAIIRAGSAGALVVDGGPGTGKTVVALHRTAFLTYSDPRFGQGRGGVLFIGPHEPYLAYVADVLPSLGEDGVRTCTLRDLVPEGASAGSEPDPEVARLKATAAMVEAIEPAVALYEEPPTTLLTVETPWAEVRLSPSDWAEAFAVADPGSAHNETRDDVWSELLTILVDQHPHDDVSTDDVRRFLEHDAELLDAFGRAWPIVEAADLVADLWEVPAYLRRCAPWLTAEDRAVLRREPDAAWTVEDLPLLDAAYRRLGDPEASRRRRRDRLAVQAERARMSDVIDDLVTTARETQADEFGLGLVTMLRHEDLQQSLVDPGVCAEKSTDALTGTFAHVVVDEAQELTDAEWQMVLARCPSRSLTIVGDRAQARRGFAESWEERLRRVGMTDVHVRSLAVNYRTPQEVMAAAEPVIRSVLPDANVPTSVRQVPGAVERRPRPELSGVLSAWLAEPGDGTACVVALPTLDLPPLPSPRIRRLAPELTKGLEFDLVVLVDPDGWGDGYAASVDRYVAMTRATQRLVVLT